jgi:hypothetical protein
VCALRRPFNTPFVTIVAIFSLFNQLVIACAKIANLLLARSAARACGMAMRLSIGAARWQPIRQLE